MQPVQSHPWTLSAEEAIALQRKLATLVSTEDDLPDPVQTVAGIDLAYNDKQAFAAVVLLEASTCKVQQVVSAEIPVQFPYVPGLLSFREVPAIMRALEKQSVRPDLIVCDGQGIAHPRRFGIACHVGVLYDLPTIGCAKSRLIGKADDPAPTKGSYSELVYKREVVGAVLRTRDNVNPLYISPGHRISVRTALHWILKLTTRYRLPEPTRLADQLVGQIKRKTIGSLFADLNEA
ncbi:MAG: deoxyribonuclease V [Acidobacteriaceae bacterium]|nr:deoxyribonuclease V [Acidobacteriaceae bacterium]MBV9938085.1 deoxyribonuclease V [Acidobacteriaceae bacterium]